MGVAQAAMWRVCNDLPFEMMAEQTGKVMNVHEIALAARFVEALDALAHRRSGRPGGLAQSRVFVQVRGEGSLAAEAKRLLGQLEGLRILGLPIQVVESEELPSASSARTVPERRADRCEGRRDPGRDRGQLVLRRRSLASAGQGLVPGQLLGFGA